MYTITIPSFAEIRVAPGSNVDVVKAVGVSVVKIIVVGVRLGVRLGSGGVEVVVTNEAPGVTVKVIECVRVGVWLDSSWVGDKSAEVVGVDVSVEDGRGISKASTV